MKVLLHYEDIENSDLHKTLKITLPKSWKNGPTSKLLDQFVESYNANDAFGGPNPLQVSSLHLSIRESDGEKSKLVELASDAVIEDVIPDRNDVYVCHGAAKTLQEMRDEREQEQKRKQEELKNSVACTHFGCKNRFPKGGPYPACRYHKSAPVFHETAKWWSCCPNKKAYDWETFQAIPGCMTGTCTEVKEQEGPQFLGGSDLRDRVEAVQLKSIDDFNKAQAAGGADAAPVLERLRSVFLEMGVEHELFDQVVAGIRKEQTEQHSTPPNDADLLELVRIDLGKKIKNSLKAIVAEQQRIK